MMAERAAVEAMTTDAEWVAARVRDAVASRDRLASGTAGDGIHAASVGREFFARADSRRPSRSRARCAPSGIAIRPFRELRGIGDAFRITAAPVAGDGTRAFASAGGQEFLMRITLFDYGAGNLHSLAKALRGNGREVRVRDNARAAVDTDVLVLPGVGAFEPAARALAPGRDAMRDAISSGLPCLGICLGMQLLFDASDEGAGAGLGVFAGSRHQAPHGRTRRRSDGTLSTTQPIRCSRARASRTRTMRTVLHAGRAMNPP